MIFITLAGQKKGRIIVTEGGVVLYAESPPQRKGGNRGFDSRRGFLVDKAGHNNVSGCPPSSVDLVKIAQTDV